MKLVKGKKKNPGQEAEKRAIEAVKTREKEHIEYIFQDVEIPEPERATGPIYETQIPEIKLPESITAAVKEEAERRAEEQTGPAEIKEFTRVRHRLTNETGTVIAVSADSAQVVYDSGTTKIEPLEDIEAI